MSEKNKKAHRMSLPETAGETARKRLSFIVKAAVRRGLSLLYPPVCPVCGCLLECNADICISCAKKMPKIRGPRCQSCGKSVLREGLLCNDCREKNHQFRQGVGLYLYDDTMKKIMLDVKYGGRRRLCRFLGELLYKDGMSFLEKWHTELLIPVPVHPHRLRQRGYNQAELMAKTLSTLSGIPVECSSVVRKNDTRAMKALTRAERQENIKNVFGPGDAPVFGKRVTIIDDIYTTGATIDGVSEVLRELGAADVTFLSVCIGEGFMLK